MLCLVTLTGRLILFGRETKEEWNQQSRGEVAGRDWEKGENCSKMYNNDNSSSSILNAKEYKIYAHI